MLSLGNVFLFCRFVYVIGEKLMYFERVKKLDERTEGLTSMHAISVAVVLKAESIHY